VLFYPKYVFYYGILLFFYAGLLSAVLLRVCEERNVNSMDVTTW